MSTRNFDHRVILQRQQALHVSQEMYRNMVSGQMIRSNPQNTNGSAQTVLNFMEGYQNAFAKSQVGGPTTGVVDVGGIQNVLEEQFPPENLVLPAPPTGLVITPSATQVSIAFTAGNRGSGSLVNYQYTINGGVTFVTCSPPIVSSPIVITGLASNTAYLIALKAVTTVGVSAPSAFVSVVTTL